MNPFQWLIDESQKPPEWWCRQSAKMICVGEVLGDIFTKVPWSVADCIGIFFSGACCGLYVYWSRSAESVAKIASRSIRLLVWGLILHALFRYVFMNAITPEHAAGLCSGFAAVAFWEFALCRPPAPPKRRQRLARGAA